jgi:hypothetical protein
MPFKNVPDVFVPSGKVNHYLRDQIFGHCVRQAHYPLDYFRDAIPLVGKMKPGDHP